MKISTKELFDKFFEEKDPEVARKTRPQIDREEVYEYENKLNKQLVEMDVDELFDMILSFNGNRKYSNGGNFAISYNSYSQIASMYRSLFNFYIDNYEVVRNPFNDKRMRGTIAAQRLAENRDTFNVELVESLINNLHNDFEPQHAMYYECILRLFLEGFAKAEEIVMLDEEMISKKDKVIHLPGRDIQLSDRCFMLLESVHNMEDIEGWRGDYAMVAWDNHYFKFIVRPKGIAKFQANSMGEVANIINRAIIVNVKNRYSVDISYRLLYMLGFYEFLKKQYGEDRTRELIVSVRNSEDASDLMGAARLYGITNENVTNIKKCLRPYIK